MSFTLIVGPMKSGKSLELIARVAPLEFAKKKVLYVQPKQNGRDTMISSRAGISTESMAVSSLCELSTDFDVIGIDEVHMFSEDAADFIEKSINASKVVVASGLDLDYRGLMQPTIKKLLELKPDEIVLKTAVCEVCNRYEAQYSQILQHDKPVLDGLPSIVPEDGTYEYQARCRNCFIKAS